MTQTPLHTWLLEHESRALLARLRRVKPFALQETTLPAAAISPAAQDGIERFLISGRRNLDRSVVRYVRWLRDAGAASSPVEQQRRYTMLKLRFNLALSQLDLFSEAVTQRSEQAIGVWLAGLDVAAEDALDVGRRYYSSPPIVCYVHRGMGGAIRRARTRLPGGGDNPVAIIRIPRERMIGYGIASSLMHEVGHQGAALLKLVESLRPVLRAAGEQAPPGSRQAWRLYERWISEIVADVWSIGRVGVSSTMGLIGLVSLPRTFVFRISPGDPHPFPWIRVQLSCAFGDAMYPHPQWRQLAAVWSSFYPHAPLTGELRRTVDALMAALPAFVRAVLEHRPVSLRGRSFGDLVCSADRTPQRLIELYEASRANPSVLRSVAPSIAFGAIGQARAGGRLTPEGEDRLLDELINHWALQSTLNANARLARVQQLPRWATTPLPDTGPSALRPLPRASARRPQRQPIDLGA